MRDESSNSLFLYYDPYWAKALAPLSISRVTYKCQLHCGIATYRIRHRTAQCCSAPVSEITHTAPERRLGGEILLGSKGAPSRNKITWHLLASIHSQAFKIKKSNGKNEAVSELKDAHE